MNIGRLLAVLLSAIGLSYAAEADVRHEPLNIGAFHEFGSVYHGLYSTGKNTELRDMEWVDHFGAFISKEAVVNERLHLSGGLGGVFQFRKPETVGAGFAYHQRKAFFIGPSRTEAVYHFGDIESPWLKLGMGMFPYKYNPDASNLGEYLFRARAYPTILNTGGYVFANSASANLQGLKANFKTGNFKMDVLFVTETELAPFYDWSLAAIFNYTLGEGLLDLGAGVNFSHLIPVKPSRTSSSVRENSYLTGIDPVSGEKLSYSGSETYYSNASGYYYNKNTAEDSVQGQYFEILSTAANFYYGEATDTDSSRAMQYDADGLVQHSLLTIRDSLGAPEKNYFSSRSILLMLRASFDPKKLFDASLLGLEDLKVYFEANVLGTKNHPMFYTDIKQRIPIMAGINIPCFQLLDLLAVQVEYLNSPWLNNTFPIGSGGGEGVDRRVIGAPYFPSENDTILSQTEYADAGKRDNWKWSVLARKNLVGRMSLSVQAARDHLRIPSSNFYYGPQYESNEVTTFEDSWYWAMQLSWGM